MSHRSLLHVLVIPLERVGHQCHQLKFVSLKQNTLTQLKDKIVFLNRVLNVTSRIVGFASNLQAGFLVVKYRLVNVVQVKLVASVELIVVAAQAGKSLYMTSVLVRVYA
jgi:hypothetical protein